MPYHKTMVIPHMRKLLLPLIGLIALIGTGLLLRALSAVSVSELPPESVSGQLGPGGQSEVMGEVTSPTPTDAKQPTTPTPTTAQPTPIPVQTPARALGGLANWKLTLPTGSEDSPTEIRQPKLIDFVDANYFFYDVSRRGTVFRANAGGVTTGKSSYPRSELREMTSNGATNASWSNTSGTHIMTVTQAITKTTPIKPEVVAAQIHDSGDSGDDVMMVRLEGSRLFVEGTSKDWGTLDPNYTLGKRYTVKIEAGGGQIKVYYNNELKVTKAISGSGYYFKAGCYTQSNVSKGDVASGYAEVIIYSLSVSHT